MNKKKAASIGIAIIISTFFLYLIISYQPFRDRSKTDPLPKTTSDLMLQKARMVEMEGDKKKWELEADVAEYFTDKKFSLFKEVKVIFYDKEGNEIILTGKEGKVFTETKDIEIKKDVQIINNEGNKLNTESLFYNSKTKIANTSDPVKFEGNEFILTGNGARLDVETGKIAILNNVNSTFKEEKKK